MVEVRVDQGGMYALAEPASPEVRVDQAGVYALATIGVPVRVDQAGIQALVAITPEVRVDQVGMYAVADGSPCGTQWAQIWTITRLDGEEFRFTSKDTGLVWLGETYRACDSLVPSASENVGNVDEAGSMDLSGALGGDGIHPGELYSGKFDGADVEAWLVPWAGEGRQRRLLKGSFGSVQQSETGFKVEIIGDGGKLAQTPLVFMLEPGCRWVFGDRHCQKDLAPLTVTGTVDSAIGQRSFVDAARVEAAGYFSRGVVTFTSGWNDGVSAEIKEHSAGGVFELWPRPQFPIIAGDNYSMTPGCTNLKDATGGTNGCTAWANLVRYGGFDKVPGGDKKSAAANVKAPG